MAITRIRQAAGLVTDPSALDVPEGALRVATNVVMVSPGVLQPRPGFGETLSGPATGAIPFQLIPYDGELAVISGDGGVNEIGWAGSPLDGFDAVNPAKPAERYRLGHFIARESLYLTSGAGLRKFTSGAGGSHVRAGLRQTHAIPNVALANAGAGSSSFAVAANHCAAYRLVYKRTDANGYVIRSAPSSRFIVQAPGGAYPDGAQVTLQDIRLRELVAGDVIEVYRTRGATPVTSDPGEDYYLAATHTITSANIVAGVVSNIFDAVNDAQLGAALYSSASQFGALASKEPPPLGTDAAWWGDCAWIANLRERSALSLHINKVTLTTDFPVNLGLNTITILLTATAGSPVLSYGAALTATQNAMLAAGQYAQMNGLAPDAASTFFPPGTKVLSKNAGAGLITLTANALSTGGVNVDFGDVVAVCGDDYYACSGENPLTRQFLKSGLTNHAARVAETAESLARVIAGYAAINNRPYTAVRDDSALDTGTGELLILARHPEDPAVTAQCVSRGAAFVPNLTATVTADDSDRPGSLAWSALEEPEAWPPANVQPVGESRQAILRIIPLRNSLLIWKRDGLYALSGSGPSSWVIDVVDKDLRLLSVDAVCVLDNACYAWTDRGVVAVRDGGGLEVVSQAISDELRARSQGYPLGSERDIESRTWMAADRLYGLVILAGPWSDQTQYVYHSASGAWTAWERDDRHMVYDPAIGRLVAAPAVSSWSVRRMNELEDEDDRYGTYDRAVLLTTSGTGTTVTAAETAFLPDAPAIGDVLFQNSANVARITGVSLNAGTYTLTLSASLTIGGSGNTIWYQAFECVVEWAPQHSAGLGQRWQEAHLEFGYLRSQLRSWPIEVGGYAHRDLAPSTVTYTVADDTALVPPQRQIVRVGLPRNVVRTPYFVPRMRVLTAGAFWRLEHLYLHHSGGSRRTAR